MRKKTNWIIWKRLKMYKWPKSCGLSFFSGGDDDVSSQLLSFFCNVFPKYKSPLGNNSSHSLKLIHPPIFTITQIPKNNWYWNLYHLVFMKMWFVTHRFWVPIRGFYYGHEVMRKLLYSLCMMSWYFLLQFCAAIFKSETI